MIDRNASRVSRLRVLPAVFAVALAVLSACTSSSASRIERTESAAYTNPVSDGHGGVRNVTFYYSGRTQLTAGAHLAALGRPSIVVTTPKSDPAAAVTAIHSIGAKAYRYVQFYWAPNNNAYEGINLSQHPGWAFCRSGSTPVLGRKTMQAGHVQRWYFIDANEQAVRARLKQILAGFKADGWDGVMFDRGQAATQYAAAADGKPVWDARSTCTRRPYERRATFADAYVNMLGLAHQVGLRAMVNGGLSPFDPVTPMRPDPRDPDCQAHRWAQCRSLGDVWGNVDLVLNESGVRLRDTWWHRTFVGNQRSERNARHGHRTVLLITTATLGSAAKQTRANVVYEWSRIKLFNLAVAVNTGDGGCTDSASGICNRYGTYPDLVDVRFGKPTQTGPSSRGCGSDSVHCLWSRRYAGGIDLVNVSSKPRRMKVRVTGTTCRYVYNVFKRAPMASNRCVHSVDVSIPAWSGRPLTFSAKPHQ